MSHVGIDIGGAFTDLAWVNDSGEISFVKVDSTSKPEEGVINSVKSLNVALEGVKSVVHGQTVVVNSVIEKLGAKVGLVTTKGFRDILEIGRSNRRDIFNLRYKKPIPFVPRYLRMEIEESTDSSGKVLKVPAIEEIEKITDHFKKEGVESIAVCFVNSYTNGSNEVRTKEYLEKAGWEYVTVSSEVTREWKEYERTNTAVLNAFVQPKMKKYISTLENSFGDLGFQGIFEVMLSNGGLASSTFVKDHPITTIESGPNAGVIGAINIAKKSELDFDKGNIITLDGGSTTTKSSLITNGIPKTISDYYVGRDKFNGGYPVLVPLLEISEVGSGGTSIAYIQDGSLKVGPKAAGAYPGPACYKRGGELPTLTDAYVLNGFIDPDYFLGGKISLSRSAAQKAVENLSSKLNMSVNDAAEGIIRLANENASYVLRLISVQRGYDPRDFTLVPFGGAGPMMASFIAPDLQIKNILIPAIPLGVFSAWGMLTADIRHEQIKTVMLPVDSEHSTQIEDEFKKIEDYLLDIFKTESEVSPTFIRYADIRYRGQEHTLKTEIPTTDQKGDIEAIVEAFNKRYEMEYRYVMRDNPIEIVNIHVTGIIPSRGVSLEAKNQEGNGQPKGKRKIYVNSEWIEASVYDRANLVTEKMVSGPAIIEEATATIILMPGQKAVTDRFGNILIKVGGTS